MANTTDLDGTNRAAGLGDGTPSTARLALGGASLGGTRARDLLRRVVTDTSCTSGVGLGSRRAALARDVRTVDPVVGASIDTLPVGEDLGSTGALVISGSLRRGEMNLQSKHRLQQWYRQRNKSGW